MRLLKKFQTFLNENNKSSLVDEILLLDDELEKNPLYKHYERELVEQMIEPEIDKQLDMIAKMMGVDVHDMFDRDQIRKQIADMTYQQASQAFGTVKKDEETLREKRDSIIPMINKIIKLAEQDQEFRLCAKLKKFNDLLNQL